MEEFTAVAQETEAAKATLLSNLHSMTPAAVGSGVGDWGTYMWKKRYT
ncbi:MAG: hypothetical protein AB8V45_00590 [Candidatus Midichloria sp.]